MIMPIAIARDGFIDYTGYAQTAIASCTDFFDYLQQIFNFQNYDLQEFNGNNFKIICPDNPTGSIFIYTNQQGSYLYSVTSASAEIHKNNKIWYCDCVEMESKQRLDSLTNLEKSNAIQAIVSKNAPYYDTQYGRLFKNLVSVKGNFKTVSVLEQRLTDYTINSNFFVYIFWLKIKCYVNPTTKELTSYSPDGSYNFLFPIKVMTPADNTQALYISNELNAVGGGGGSTSIQYIISKYSPNIKSIELLPKIPSTSDFGGAKITPTYAGGQNTVAVELEGDAIMTDCGIFVPQGHTDRYDAFTEIGATLYRSLFPDSLIKGGGARGYLQCPLGQIPLDFQNTKGKRWEDIEQETPQAFYYLIKEEGFIIDGIAKVEVPPHYLNFYTDNAGQVFIQNLTTTAQELRQINREVNYQFQEQQDKYAYQQLTNVTNAGGGILSNLMVGNFLGVAGSAVGGGVNAGNLAIQNEYEKNRISRQYSKSMAEFKDKLQTQDLLASMTGKVITGQFSIYEFIYTVNANNFKIVIETNYKIAPLEDASGIYDNPKFVIIPQADYDYSCTIARGKLDSVITPHVILYDGTKNLAEFFNPIFLRRTANTPYVMQGQFKVDSTPINLGITFSLATYVKNESTTPALEYSNEIYIPIRINAQKVLTEH